MDRGIAALHNWAMERGRRRLIFYCFVLIFLIISYFLVAFAFGYRYDFVNGGFVKTGSFELKTNVRSEIFINDRLTGSTSFLGNSFSQTRLLPRSYGVRVQNPDYQVWQKRIDIGAGFLTDFPNIVLLPKELKKEILSSGSFEFPSEAAASSSDSPDGDKIAWANAHEIYVKWVNDSSHQPFKKSGDTELITRYSQTINGLQWYKDSEHLLADVGGILKLIEIDTRGGINVFDIGGSGGSFYYDKKINAVYALRGDQLARIKLSK